MQLLKQWLNGGRPAVPDRYLFADFSWSRELKCARLLLCCPNHRSNRNRSRGWIEKSSSTRVRAFQVSPECESEKYLCTLQCTRVFRRLLRETTGDLQM